jgi:hypothetical protein
MYKYLKLSLILLALILNPGFVLASTHSSELQVLSEQVESLNQEVNRLSQTIESLMALRPTVTTLMPDISERFHVMHYAGDAQDWALASHELQVLKQQVGKLQYVDPEIGAMANGFLLGNFNQIDAAIEHENLESFNKALEATVTSCNSCHVAVGSPWMKVVLNTSDGLSLRHSHALQKTKKPGDHTHKH